MSVYIWQKQEQEDRVELEKVIRLERERRAAIPPSASAFFIRWAWPEEDKARLSRDMAQKEKDGTLGKRIGKDYA